jgi:hypothetical protein
MNTKERPSTTLSIAIFSALGLASIAIKKWEQQRRRRSDVSHGVGSDDMALGIINNYISARGQSLLTPTQPYIMDYLKCLQVRKRVLSDKNTRVCLFLGKKRSNPLLTP